LKKKLYAWKRSFILEKEASRLKKKLQAWKRSSMFEKEAPCLKKKLQAWKRSSKLEKDFYVCKKQNCYSYTWLDKLTSTVWGITGAQLRVPLNTTVLWWSEGPSIGPPCRQQLKVWLPLCLFPFHFFMLSSQQQFGSYIWIQQTKKVKTRKLIFKSYIFKMYTAMYHDLDYT